MARTTVPHPWLIHFAVDAKDGSAAAEVFLDSVPAEVAAEMFAVLEAVAAAPPPSFSGGGKWEAMHGTMAGLYEVRVQFKGSNHRLFCILDRNARDLGGPSIVVIDGLTKPRRTAALPKDYKRVKKRASEFATTRAVKD